MSSEKTHVTLTYISFNVVSLFGNFSSTRSTFWGQPCAVGKTRASNEPRLETRDSISQKGTLFAPTPTPTAPNHLRESFTPRCLPAWKHLICHHARNFNNSDLTKLVELWGFCNYRNYIKLVAFVNYKKRDVYLCLCTLVEWIVVELFRQRFLDIS